jgi:hypothetical protein
MILCFTLPSAGTDGAFYTADDISSSQRGLTA